MTIHIKIDIFSFSYRVPLFLTSAPTFIIPPPTTIYGLLATILGIGENDVKKNRILIKKEIQDKIGSMKIYLSKLPDIYEFGISRINADRSKHRESWTTTISYSYGFNFSIFVSIDFKDKELEDKIKRLIEASESKFTPYIGSSENLIKEIKIVEEAEIHNNSNWMLRSVKEIENEKFLNENKEFYVLDLPAGYNDDGNWIFDHFVLEKIK